MGTLKKSCGSTHGGLRVASRPLRLRPGCAVPFLTRIPYQIRLRGEGLVVSPLFSCEDDKTRTSNHRIDSRISLKNNNLCFLRGFGAFPCFSSTSAAHRFPSLPVIRHDFPRD